MYVLIGKDWWVSEYMKNGVPRLDTEYQSNTKYLIIFIIFIYILLPRSAVTHHVRHVASAINLLWVPTYLLGTYLLFCIVFICTMQPHYSNVNYSNIFLNIKVKCRFNSTKLVLFRSPDQTFHLPISFNGFMSF